jgi:signal transduction histidine kinase/ActR/RegA family two-component response regulator
MGRGNRADPHATRGVLEPQDWRDTLLTGLAWTVVMAAPLGAVTLFYSADRFLVTLFLSGTVLVLLAATQRRRLAFRVRAWLLLGTLCTGALTAIALEGFVPNAPLVLLAAVVFATLLVGRRWGFFVMGLVSAAMLVVAALHATGAVHVLPGYEVFASFGRPMIIRFVANFVVVSAAHVVTISYLLDRGERLLAEKTRALERLQLEQRDAERMRDELARQRDAMRKARELEILGRLAGTVAHDFNNALLIIGANVDFIRNEPAYLETGLGEIDAAVMQAASTTRQLRGFSSQAAEHPRAVALGETVLRTAQLLKRVLPTNVAVTAVVDAAMTVLADEGQVQGIVTNLALNARDAMPHGGTLGLCVREATPDEVRGADLDVPCALLEVSDDGMGMSEDTQLRLFEPYFTTKGAAGTGLGLASVKMQVEEAGGRILVTSALGQGTRLCVFWPLREEAKASAPASVEGATRGTGTVLVVEDDAHVRVAMARALGWRGFSVLEASSGEEALTVARRHGATIDVLCSDCVMPGMPVRQMIQGFRRIFPAARVVLCSAYAPDQVAPPRETIDAFVPKPFALDSLASIVGALVPRVVREPRAAEV